MIRGTPSGENWGIYPVNDVANVWQKSLPIIAHIYVEIIIIN